LLVLGAAFGALYFKPETIEPQLKFSVEAKLLFKLLFDIGLPYFALASTTPLLQGINGARKIAGLAQYKLYAWSNLGSLVALLIYPTVVEPIIGLALQWQLWTALFAAFILLLLLQLFRHPGNPQSASAETGSKITNEHVGMWLLLAAVSNATLLAETNQLAQSVASSPFIWLLPLGLYLASYALAFAVEIPFVLLVVSLLAAAVCKIAILSKLLNASPLWYLAAESFYIFSACLFCHASLARKRPPASEATLFYLITASGGVLGSLFVALVAPHFFNSYLEIPLLLIALLIVALVEIYKTKRPIFLLPSAALTLYVTLQLALPEADLIESKRSFYGVISVGEKNKEVPEFHFYRMFHGPVVHGLQFQAPDKSLLATTYYGPQSGVGLVLSTFRLGTARHIGVVGLGTGTLAVYGQTEDAFDFFEIDPHVLSLADKYFTFLNKSKARIQHILGDARITLAQREQTYDVLVIDAFSGDAVPVHLLTAEAFQLYARKLKPGGMLLVHVSNLHLDLSSVVAASALALNRPAYQIKNKGELLKGEQSSTWILVPEERFGSSLLTQLPSLSELNIKPNIQSTWSDDFHTLLCCLRF
jgi:hypothetical protein